MSWPYLLFPQPQVVTPGEGYITLAHDDMVCCSIILAQGASCQERLAAEVISTAIAQQVGVLPQICCVVPASGTVPIRIGEAARAAYSTSATGVAAQHAVTAAESYALQISTDGIVLRGVGGAGTLYAATTLAQLLMQADGDVRVPAVSIQDWPRFSTRGLFVESKWGPDRMTLQDWKHMIDVMAALKLNLLGVGIYGCWNMQYEGKVTEFLTVPLRQHPDLQTPKHISYYSVKAQAWQSLEYLPEMFTADFFGDIVAYGRERNITVRPQFNSLGHNTLIPRLIPEISAKDAQGWSTGYSFCLSNPATIPTMAGIFREIVQRYLLPWGVDSFHIGLDEVHGLIGASPHDPHRIVSPWCECSRCAGRDRKEMVLEYLVDLVCVLKEQGIRNVTIWHDQLDRMGLINADLVAALERRGVKDNVIIDWWRYAPRPIDNIHPELGLRSVMTPQAGYHFWSPYRNRLVNIETMAQVGAAQGAEGLEAYCTFDEAFDNHERLVADCGWNPEAVGSLATWEQKYAQNVYGEQWPQGLQAMQAFNRVSEFGANIDFVIFLDAYRYSYVLPDRPYPRHYPEEALAYLIEHPEAQATLAECATLASEAHRQLESVVNASLPRPTVAQQLATEALRTAGLLDIFTSILKARASYMNARIARHKGDEPVVSSALAEAKQLAQHALATHDRVVLALENVKAHYLLPHMLRSFTSLRPFLTRTMSFINAQLQADSVAPVADAADVSPATQGPPEVPDLPELPWEANLHPQSNSATK